MKALMLQAYEQFEVVDMPVPAVGLEDILIRVRACGICGSDVHGMDGGSGRRIPPLVMGHEAAGEVVRVGNRVRQLRPGDRVTMDSTLFCGRCSFCRQGQINLCRQRQVLGVSCEAYRRHGAFAEYIAVPERVAYKLPEGLGFVQASLAEPVAVAAHAANRARIAPGGTAVVVGAGMIGLLLIQLLRLSGCGRIIAVDLDSRRLALARYLGADQTVNPQEEDVAAALEEWTGGSGADVAFEVVGVQAALRTAIAALRKGGTLVLVGNLSPTVELPLQAVVTGELTLAGSCASAGEYAAALSLIAQGKIDVEALISAVVPLEAGPEWFKRLHRGEAGLLKVILQP